jgi:hypothetical protein
MSVKPFIHQPVEGCRDQRGFAEHNLVFNHHMSYRVKLEIIQLHSRSAVIIHDRIDSFARVEFEPNL